MDLASVAEFEDRGCTVPSVFFSYSHVDETLRDQLETQLALLKRQGVIETWHDRRIGVGQDIDQVIDEHIKSDEIILLLVSADFLASDYCYDVEMTRAMERHCAGEAVVIPVILRACDWHGAPFGKLNATPLDGKPVTSLPNIDEAFLQVAKAIREAVGRFDDVREKQIERTEPSALQVTENSAQVLSIRERSSNLRIAKTFTQHDKDQYQIEAFEFMVRFFENSLDELGERNANLQGEFRKIDANRFTSSIYSNGDHASSCTVWMGDGAFGKGINYVHGHATGSNTINESIRVEADEQTLFLSSTGMSNFLLSNDGQQRLSLEGAAELYWGMLIEPLQRSH